MRFPSRIVISALVLCGLSFAAGVAGDLSMAAPPNYSVVVQVPPDAIRAHPLPPLVTAAAAAAEIAPAPTVRRPRTHAAGPRQKPEATLAPSAVAKANPDRAAKDGPEQPGVKIDAT